MTTTINLPTTAVWESFKTAVISVHGNRGARLSKWDMIIEHVAMAEKLYTEAEKLPRATESDSESKDNRVPLI